MKPDRIAKLLPILTAYSQGKNIRGRASKDHKFSRIDELNEDMVNYWELEIEPDPEFHYVNKCIDGSRDYFDTLEEAKNIAHQDGEENYEFIAKLFVELPE